MKLNLSQNLLDIAQSHILIVRFATKSSPFLPKDNSPNRGISGIHSIPQTGEH